MWLLVPLSGDSTAPVAGQLPMGMGGKEGASVPCSKGSATAPGVRETHACLHLAESQDSVSEMSVRITIKTPMLRVRAVMVSPTCGFNDTAQPCI